VKPGQVLITVEEAGAQEAALTPRPAEPAGAPAPAEPAETPQPETKPAEENQAEITLERPTEQPPTAAPPPSEAPAPPEPAQAPALSASPSPPPPPSEGAPVFAAPSVRQFAREIGVDIHTVQGSGPGGRIGIEDVKRYARSMPAAASAPPTGAEQPAPTATAASALVLPDFTQFGSIEREPLTRFRRTVARNMTTSWTNIPHVTLFHTADVTELEGVRRRYRERATEAGGNLTLSVVLLKVVAAALKANPRFNASLDLETNELILKHYIHIGMAVDTERGLAVPVVQNVDQKNIIQLSVEVAQIAERARENKLTLEEMRGASFTISNLGSLGTGHFTPLINWPEVALLGVGRAEQTAVYIDGQLQPRLRLPLSLSIDHRVVDGADGARFLSWIADAIKEPLLLAMEG
jgi:pyruvate dehydrogenase E2 component (dihydrolipoamide acetyltransferase)